MPQVTPRRPLSTRRHFPGSAGTAAFAGVLFIGAAIFLAASPAEAAFLAENDAAMTKVMAMEIKPSGDVDRGQFGRRASHVSPLNAYAR